MHQHQKIGDYKKTDIGELLLTLQYNSVSHPRIKRFYNPFIPIAT